MTASDVTSPRDRRTLQQQARRWIVKIGSSSLMDEYGALHVGRVTQWMEQLRQLHEVGLEIVLVSSGAVGIGAGRLGWTERPKDLASRQAAASIGQVALMHQYEHILQSLDNGERSWHCGQVLLTHEELRNRGRYLNARNILRTLIERNVLPIVNENDAISYRPISLGDNDTLAALVSNLWDADLMVLLTDQDGLYSADPRQDPEAEFLSEVQAGQSRLETIAGSGGSRVGTGGMLAKVKAAARAARSGTSTIIANGHCPEVLTRLAAGEAIGTFFHARTPVLTARKRWLSDQLRVRGVLHLDAGAVRALCQDGASLLAVGVTNGEGDFRRGDLVSCRDPDGREIARGLSNMNIEQLHRCQGLRHEQLSQNVPGEDGVVIHRDNLVVHAPY